MSKEKKMKEELIESQSKVDIFDPEIVQVSRLRVDSSNPNKMEEKRFNALKEAIKKYGFIVPIITNKDYVIADGFHRMKAARELGMYQVPVIKLDVGEVDRRIIRQVMNKLKGEHNKELDQADFYFLQQEDSIDNLINLIPNEANSIKKLLRKFEEEKISSTDDKVHVTSYDRAKSKTKIKRGEVYKLGPHRLMCGDSTCKKEVEKLLNGKKPILMVTDPPYGVNYDPKWRDKVDKKGKLGNSYKVAAEGSVQNDNIIDWSESYKLFPGNIIYVWHAARYSNIIQDNLENIGFEIVSHIIWNKPQATFGRGDYHWKHEPCLYAVKKGKNHNWQGSIVENTVWDIKGMSPFGKSNDENDEKTGHGTQKPIECMRKPILNNTKKGEGVYDPFCGSGTTIIAADQSERVCFAMELDPIYCQVILDRWEKYKGQKAIKEE